jgi:hypothetical protein
MRLRACIASLLLGIGGCAQIPDHIRVEVDGSSVDFKKADPDGNSVDLEAPPVDAPRR